MIKKMNPVRKASKDIHGNQDGFVIEEWAKRYNPVSVRDMDNNEWFGLQCRHCDMILISFQNSDVLKKAAELHTHNFSNGNSECDI